MPYGCQMNSNSELLVSGNYLSVAMVLAASILKKEKEKELAPASCSN